MTKRAGNRAAHRRRRRVKRPAEPEDGGEVNLSVGSGPGSVAVTFDRAIRSVTLSPDAAMKTAAALVNAANEAREKAVVRLKELVGEDVLADIVAHYEEEPCRSDGPSGPP